MTDPPRVSAVLVNWNAGAVLERCLASVRATGYPNLDVVVVDNASSDGSAGDLRERDGIRLIENAENRGFARAANQGIRATGTTSHLLLLNPDTVLDRPDVIHRSVAELERHPRAAIVGVRLRRPDGSDQLSCARFRSLRREFLDSAFARPFRRRRSPLFYFQDEPPATRWVDWVAGAFMLIRRSALDRVGLLDEGTPMDHEDYDLCYRMALAGWWVRYLADTSAVHVGNVSGAKRWTEHERQVLGARSADYFLRKHHGVASALAYRSLVLADRVAKAAALRLLGRHEAVPAWDEEVRIHGRALRAFFRSPAA